MAFNLFAKKRGRKKGIPNKPKSVGPEIMDIVKDEFKESKYTVVDLTNETEEESNSTDNFEQKQAELIEKTKAITQEKPKVEPEFVSNDEDIFNKIKADTNTGKQEDEQQKNNNDNPQQPKAETKGLINGKILIMVVDMLIPMMFEMVLGKKRKFKAKDIRMDADQKESVTPLADIVAQDIAIKSPTTAFAIICMAIYGFNMMQFTDQ